MISRYRGDESYYVVETVNELGGHVDWCVDNGKVMVIKFHHGDSTFIEGQGKWKNKATKVANKTYVVQLWRPRAYKGVQAGFGSGARGDYGTLVELPKDMPFLFPATEPAPPREVWEHGFVEMVDLGDV